MSTQIGTRNMINKRLEGKVAIVTGGDQGIGRGIALRLAAGGSDIAFCYRANCSGAEEVVAAITNDADGEGTPQRAVAIHADISDISQIREFIATVFEYFGSIDILVNNAGLERSANCWEVSEQDYDLVVSVNLKGVFFTTQAVVSRWITTKLPGRIVNISSVHEELPFPAATTVQNRGSK